MLLALNISQGSFLPGLKYPLALIGIILGQIKNQNSNFIFWVNGFQNNSLSPIWHGLLQKIDTFVISCYFIKEEDHFK